MPVKQAPLMRFFLIAVLSLFVFSFQLSAEIQKAAPETPAVTENQSDTDTQVVTETQTAPVAPAATQPKVAAEPQALVQPQAAAEVVIGEAKVAAEPQAPTETNVIAEPPVPDQPKAPVRPQVVIVESPVLAQPKASVKPQVVIGEPKKEEPPLPNLYADQFFLKPNQRLQYQTTEVGGFVFVKTPNRERNTQYSVVTDFGGGVLKTQYLPGVNTLEDIKKWVDAHQETAKYEGVEIKRLTIPSPDPKGKTLYWVGQRGFDTLDKAQSEVIQTKSVVEAQGGSFEEMVTQAQAYIVPPEQAPPVEISPAQYQKEEELVLKMLDQMDVGEKLYGPFMGVPAGEPLIWQSFGETSWRKTNLSRSSKSNQYGFWANRLVFKGIRFPFNTLDPYVEAIGAMDTSGVDFASVAKFNAGLEWRPLARNPWLFNYRPWGGISILEWVRNWRFYVQYGERINLKDEFVGSKDYDTIFGAQIFYEWGTELPPLDQPPPKKFSEYVEEIVWGEYFGDYRFEHTNFGPEDEFNAWLLNSSVILGIKLPGIPLPHNPINDELVIMPYFRFEQITNTRFSFSFQNQYFVAVGARWMPFRTWRWKENEWLSKTKVFVEFVGVGDVHNNRVNGSEVPYAEVHDLRIGVNFSQRRF